MYLLLKYK